MISKNRLMKPSLAATSVLIFGGLVNSAHGQQNYGSSGLSFYPEIQRGVAHGPALFSELSAATGALKTVVIRPYKNTKIVLPRDLRPGTVIGNIDEDIKLRVPRGGMTSCSRLFSDGRVRVTLVSSGADRGLRIVTSRDLTIDVTLGYNIIRGTSCSGAKVQARVTAVGTRGPMVANMPIKPC